MDNSNPQPNEPGRIAVGVHLAPRIDGQSPAPQMMIVAQVPIEMPSDSDLMGQARISATLEQEAIAIVNLLQGCLPIVTVDFVLCELLKRKRVDLLADMGITASGGGA